MPAAVSCGDRRALLQSSAAADTTCPVCGVTFVSLHALRTHVGKSHPEHSTAKTGQGYSYRHPDLMCPLQEVFRILELVCGTRVPLSLSASAVLICESFQWGVRTGDSGNDHLYSSHWLSSTQCNTLPQISSSVSLQHQFGGKCS